LVVIALRFELPRAGRRAESQGQFFTTKDTKDAKEGECVNSE